MITRDDELTTMMKQQEEDETYKLMGKEQRAMTSTETRRALLIVQRVLSLQKFMQSSIPHNLGVD